MVVRYIYVACDGIDAMPPSATVRYNSDHERTSITVDARNKIGATGKFKLDGSTAVLTEVRQREGQSDVYGGSIQFLLDFAEDLPFVQAVTIDEYDAEEL